MKKLFFSVLLAASLSLASVVSVFALPEAKALDSSHSWKKVNDEWTVVDTYGNSISGWVSYNGDTYYLDKNGVMKTGWLKANGSWYYLSEDSGKLITDQWVDNYYVNADGVKTKTR
ncbi:hypothetical protein [Bacteroides heparinolyticus]|uniref:hypothetical protein n=1 Tax=Prevotella heparinolytica TaxID=28113 RepID=UPI0035A0AD70